MIHLIDNYYLDADEQQFILTEWDGSFSKKQNKDGTFFEGMEVATILQKDRRLA